MPVSTGRRSSVPSAFATSTAAASRELPGSGRSALAGTVSTFRALATTKKTCAVICVISRPSSLGTSNNAG
jgi:hypothetical protein